MAFISSFFVVAIGVFSFIAVGIGVVYIWCLCFPPSLSTTNTITYDTVKKQQITAFISDGLLFLGNNAYKVSNIESIEDSFLKNGKYWVKFKSGQSICLNNNQTDTFSGYFMSKEELISHIKS